MRKIKILSLVLALILVAAVFASCGKPKTQAIDDADAIEHKSYASVYELIGSKVTIDMVEETADGKAYVTVDGVKYELGMDFLSMAMVYNCKVPAGSTKYQTEEDVNNEWWKLYIQRWNILCPEVPLYSNEYYDLYNAKITDFVTNPYWDATDAIISAKVTTADNSVILGSSTELSGAFRSSSWGKSSPGSSDLDIETLTSGYATVQTSKDGTYIWNMMALAEIPTSVINEDGTITYTIKIKDDLVFSDGSAINAKNYIAGVLCNSSPVGVAAGGSGNSGKTVVGFDAFKAYDGTGDKVYFTGIKLLGDYEFSVTLTKDYAGYYYGMANAGFSPSPLQLWLGAEGDIIVNENKEVALNDAFYAKETKDDADVYKLASVIVENLKWNSSIPYSGPYTVQNYDESTRTATLKLNTKYPGDTARGKASIETITYVKVVSETQMDQFKAGEVDIIAGITGGDDTRAALTMCEQEPTKYATTHYSRAGYGKLAFRCDLGPANFTSVRQAVMYTLNRPEFAQTFTGGYGSVVDGPYYEGYSAYQATKNTIKINKYTYSVDSAKQVLIDDGWIYNEKGETFVEGKDAVRYKKLSGYELSKVNLHYSTVDGKYKTVKINGSYYMPLALNYYGTQPNEVTDQLLTAWQTNPNATTNIGMYIQYISTTFSVGLYAEYCQDESEGWDGVAKNTCINFATGFTSAAYDFAFNWTLDQDIYSIYSNNYLMDEADFAENYSK